MWYLCAVACLWLQVAEPDAVPLLRQQLRVLESSNPTLEAATKQIQMTRASAEAAGNLADPLLKAGVFLESVETRVGPQEFKLGISQKLPTLRKWRTRHQVADTRVRTALEHRAVLQLELETLFLENFAEWFYLQRTLAIHREHLVLLQTLETVSDERYRSNQADYQDLIKIEIEMDRINDLIASIELTLPQRRASLNRILGRDPREPLNLPQSLPLLPFTPEDLPREPVAQHPKLALAESRIQGSQANLDLVKQASSPDFTVGLEWVATGHAAMPISGSGDDPIILSVGLNLPVWRGQRKAQERAVAATTEGFTAQKSAVRLQLETELAQAAFQYRDAHRRAQLYRDQVLPKAREALEVVLAAFQNGKVKFSEVIDAEEALLNFNLTMEKAYTEQFKAWVAIRAASADVHMEVF